MGQAYDNYLNGQLTIISMGSNVTSIWGDPSETVFTALLRVSKALSITPKTSRLFRTPAFPAGSGPDFVNAAAAFVTSENAQKVLSVLHATEQEAGRTRDKRWGERTLDLDLIGQAAQILPDDAGFAHWRNLPPEQQTRIAPDQLILPHPRLQDRAFVLVPLMDVAADWVHPVSGLSVAQMCAVLPQSEIDSVRPIN